MHVEATLRLVGHPSERRAEAVRNRKFEVALIAREDEPKMVRPGVEIGQVHAAPLGMRHVLAQQGHDKQPQQCLEKAPHA